MQIKNIKTNILEITYFDEGPSTGPVIFLLHGWPDDASAWKEIAPNFNAAGYRTITPYLRGFGPTQFLSADTIRDASGAALAQDVIDLADALQVTYFAVAGHDWGARAAYTLATLFPHRVNCIAALALAYQPRAEFTIPSFSQSRLFWYQWFMSVDAGAEAVKADPVGFARIQWDTWSPEGWFNEAEFTETARSFLNPDWVAITLNGYRRRFKWEPSDARYNLMQKQLGVADKINIPTLMIQGGADTCDEPATSEGFEQYFTAGYERVVIAGAGHFPLRENPEEVTEALLTHFNRFVYQS